MTHNVELDLARMRSVPAYRAVVRLIENKILRGDWALGHGLPSEIVLAGRLGVNRSTLREAIRVLEENGLVRRREGGKQLMVSASRDTDVAAHDCRDDPGRDELLRALGRHALP